MAAKKYDVVIIGAGISGMTAALRLKQAGKIVLVLEARNRVGGRTWSQKHGTGVVDLGGQWIGPSQTRVNKLAQELELETFSTYQKGRKTLDLNGKVSTYKGLIPKVAPHHLILMQIGMWVIDYLGKKISKETPWSHKKSKEYDAMTLESWARKYMPSKKARALLAAALRVIFGCEPGDMSFLHFLFYTHSGGGLMTMIDAEGGSQHDRFVLGADEIARSIMQKIGKASVKLNTPVTKIEQKGKSVTVYSGSKKFLAKKAIIAMPPALISKVDFLPKLPALKRQLNLRVPMGSIVKCYVNYETAFWREKGFSGEVVCTQGPICVVFDNVSSDETQPALLAFVGGDDARGWSKKSLPDRKQTIVNELVRYFGPEAANAGDYIEGDWTEEEYSGGGPIGYFTTNTLSTFGPELRTPFMNVHFSGSETAREFTGFIEGAVESGERVANELISISQ